VSHLTPQRLGSYLEDRDQDLDRAFALYEWNIEASASILALTAMVEVIVRNAMNTELDRWVRDRGANQPWYDVAQLDPTKKRAVREAKHRATRAGNTNPGPDDVVPELTLGFWRFLVQPRYLTSLWMPALRHAFPHGPADYLHRQREVAAAVQRLAFVRNRAAHHEPIHRRDLANDLESAAHLVGWITPDGEAWVRSRTTLHNVLSRRPS
jgi:hypothetical protein